MPLARDTGVPTQVIQSLSVVWQGVTPALPGQFISWSGNPVATLIPIKGVLQDDAVQGRAVSVAMAGVVEVLSGGAIAVGSIVGSDASNRGVVVAPGDQSIGRAMSATTAAGQKFQMYITREGTN